MREHEIELELAQLALGHPVRNDVLAARRARMSSRSRALTCQTCGEVDRYARRGTNDICAHCLRDLWAGQDAISKLNGQKAGEGLVPFVMTAASHNLPYPHLGATQVNVPKGATFDRSNRLDGVSEGPERTIQRLYHEFVSEMGKVFPVPTGARSEAAIFLASGSAWRHDQVAAYLPPGAVKALVDLWSFVIWQSNQSYLAGLKAGSDLLGRMEQGLLTQDAFDRELAAQQRRLTETAIDAAAGFVGHKS